MGYINLSARVSSSFTFTMHAITSLIATFGAGRQSKPTHAIHIDTADAITGLAGVQSPEDIMMPVALQSLVQQISKVLEDKDVGKAAAQDIGLSERRILTGLLLLKSSRS